MSVKEKPLAAGGWVNQRGGGVMLLKHIRVSLRATTDLHYMSDLHYTPVVQRSARSRGPRSRGR